MDIINYAYEGGVLMTVKSHKKNNINFMRFEKTSERRAYAIGGAALLLGHIFYLIMFGILGVHPMMYFNIFSVAFYTVMLVLLFRTGLRKGLVIASLAEIVLHSCLGIITLGWNMGFAMFLLFIMPIPFYMPLKRLLTPYLCTLVPLTLFIVMRAKYGRLDTAMYTFRDSSLNDMIYFINTALGALILLYFSSIYMISREVMQFKLTSKNESLQKLATIDPLTRLFNRRAMGEYLKLIQHNSERTGKSYTVCLGDIDDFKQVNDSYGHGAGDDALKQSADIISRSVPAEGYAARWGGEEFLFVIPNSDVKDGRECAEKIRRAIADRTFRSGGRQFGITITIGVAEGKAGDDIEKIISLADKRLYAGKSSGKNKVINS